MPKKTFDCRDMLPMKAIFVKHGCVLVKEQSTIEVLQKSGIGARVLNPIVTSVDGVETDQVSPLLLLDEEAFYLSCKDALVVELYDTQETATLHFLWSAFVVRNANFPVKYKAFSYFKDKSYVVRTGINFGVDYCIYHTLPSLCHSEMCVTVVDATQNPVTTVTTADSIESTGNAQGDVSQLNWRHVTTLTRVVPDVNKICVICYVLPASVATRNTVSGSSFQTDATAIANRISPLDILANAVDEMVCTSGSSMEHTAVAATSLGECNIKNAPEPPTVSPYLSTMFPAQSATPRIDFSTHNCLESLSVHPVTALVRRTPALAETYQTIKMVQETYHRASTAQKKRDLKAANQKTKLKKNNNKSKEKNHQKSKQVDRALSNIDRNCDINVNEQLSVSDSASATGKNKADQQAFLLSADPATLSGRQKRVAKYLQKAQTQQQKVAILLPQSKQMKERRDHRENRSKTMSNKNQSLLDLMQGGESKDSQEVSGGGTAADSSVVVGEMSTGTENTLDTPSQLQNSTSAATIDVTVPTTMDTAIDAGHPVNDDNVSDIYNTAARRRKRDRTQYEQDNGKEAGGNYLNRAAKHCIIL